MKIKYITFDTGYTEAIIVFPFILMHRDIQVPGTVLGAGFIELDNNKWICYGESVSLNVKSRVEDTKIANNLLAL